MKNCELLRQLPLYDDINILRKEMAFRGYDETYELEIINNRSLSDLLFMSKISVKNLFDELLREKSGFKHIISVKITLKKQNNGNELDPRTLYFNSVVETVTNRRYHLDDSFEEILNKLDIWINEGSAWVINNVEGL